MGPAVHCRQHPHIHRGHRGKPLSAAAADNQGRQVSFQLQEIHVYILADTLTPQKKQLDVARNST